MANRDMLSLAAIARAVWNLVALASRTSRAISSVQYVSGSSTIADGSTANIDITVNVTDYTRTILVPMTENLNTGNGMTAPGYFRLTTGGGGSVTIRKSPRMVSNSVLRFTIDANATTGAVDLYYNLYVVEFS